MKFFEGLCEIVTQALGLSASWGHGSHLQQPVGPGPFDAVQPIQGKQPFRVDGPTPPHLMESLFPTEKEIKANERLGNGAPPKGGPLPPGPIFAPPNSSPGFSCDYTAMRGWKHTGGVGMRSAWLEKPIMDSDSTGGIYNIFTNYDQYAPIGVTRKYHLNVTDHNINADGMNRPDGGKTFNEQYPGPWIEACWGDWVEITVENHLRYNGTAIHWHGVRLLNAFEHDGVNAVSQCAIAPGDHYTYKFRVTQYGTSWYHSHYSLQYADGLAGPLTFHGPHSGDFHVALDPYLFGDWSHNSAFEDYSAELRAPPARLNTVILNGRGYYNCTNNPNPDCTSPDRVEAPPIYEQIFERGRRYLLRLINTSTASTFIFSIDKHMLQVVAMDFVPIEPYYRDSILVGIGQRYHVVVEARPSNDLIPVEEQNYWIRITGADGCFSIEPGQKGNDKLGIVRYNRGNTATPTSKAYGFNKTCADEPYESLVPVVPWEVDARDHPANSVDPDYGDSFEVAIDPGNATHTVPHGNFTRWDMVNASMWLNFTDPVIDHLHDYSWNPEEYALITENYTVDDWVYLIITAQGTPKKVAEGKHQYVPVAHPMHLHGHDFVLLAQTHKLYDPKHLSDGTFNYDNPPRRDVVLLPRDGYIAIGFKTDNPGVWIFHCHIAWHASSGLGHTVIEHSTHSHL